MNTKSSFPSVRFGIELDRFRKLRGDQVVENIGLHIASKNFYVWRSLYAAMHKVPREKRHHAWKFLKAAKAERKIFNDAEQQLERIIDKAFPTEYEKLHGSTRSRIARSFEVPITPHVYTRPLCEVRMGSGVIGRTIRAERIPGNRARIWYVSKFDFALECVKTTNDYPERDLWKRLGVDPIVRPVYHCVVRKNVAAVSA